MPKNTKYIRRTCSGKVPVGNSYHIEIPKSARLEHWASQASSASKPCHVGIHWIALAAESSQGSTHLTRIQIFFRFLHHFVLAKLATSRDGYSMNTDMTGFRCVFFQSLCPCALDKSSL